MGTKGSRHMAEEPAAEFSGAATDADPAPSTDQSHKTKSPANNPVELGSIHYVTTSGKQLQSVLDKAKASGKPIFANFAEWPG